MSEEIKGFLILLFVILLIAVIITGIALAIFFCATPKGKSIINNYEASLKSVDEQKYEKQKEVEDTCRAMIASYESDKLIYEQNINSDSELDVELAKNARIRANKTASTYNNYILENDFVWKENVPEDISMQLDLI